MSAPESALWDRWASVLEQKADAPALLDASGAVRATFAEIEHEAAGWSERLRGWPAGSVIGLQLANDFSWPAILLAVWRAGQIALPLDASLRGDLTGRILENAGARALISEAGVRSLAPAREAEIAEGTCLLKVTSGTTGSPRLIAFTMGQVLADADQIGETMGLRGEDVNYGAIPFSHSYGFSNLLTPLLTRGIALVVAQDHFPHAMLAGLTASRATVLPGVPIFYQSLSRLNLALPATVRLCITASAPLAGSLFRDFYERNGRKIHSFYGASECGGICYDASGEIDLPEGFVGRPIQGVEVEHVAETGRIVIRSRAVGLGYVPPGQDDTLRGGEFRPSDLLEVMPQGWVITGRESDFINITGKKLDPQMMESIIEKIPGVSRAVVCGVPHDRRGERAVAVVETRTTSREEIYAACRKVLAPWQMPSDVWLVEHLPGGTRGKVRRGELVAAYLAAQT